MRRSPRSASHPADWHAIVAGQGLHWLEWGDRDAAAVPLLLLHDSCSSARQFEDVAPALAADRRVIAPDLRGHGESAWHPEASYAVRDFARDLGGLIDHLELQRVALLGHALGGTIAIHFAAEHPDRVRRLILEDAGPPPEAGSPLRPARTAPPPAFANAADALAFLRGLGRMTHASAERALAIALRREADGTLIYRADVRGLAHAAAGGDLDEESPAERWRQLRKLTMPTLVMRGAESIALDATTARRMAEENTLVTLAEIPEAGGGVHDDRPEAFLRSVREFLASA